MPHFCGMDKHLTPAEAWADFLQHMEQRKNNGEISRIPKDVQEGKYAAEGLRRHGLGEKRIKRLLEKYAPERYEFRGVFILHDGK